MGSEMCIRDRSIIGTGSKNGVLGGDNYKFITIIWEGALHRLEKINKFKQTARSVISTKLEQKIGRVHVLEKPIHTASHVYRQIGTHMHTAGRVYRHFVVCKHRTGHTACIVFRSFQFFVFFVHSCQYP